MSDAIAVPADDRAEVRRGPHVLLERVKAQDDVVESAEPIQCLERYDDPAIVEHAELHPMAVPERVDAHGSPLSCRSVRRPLHCRLGCAWDNDGLPWAAP